MLLTILASVSTFLQFKNSNKFTLLIIPGQGVKRYPCGVRLDNRKVLRAPGL